MVTAQTECGLQSVLICSECYSD